MMDEREKEIRELTQTDALLNNRKPTCNITHHAGCACQIQRYIKEKLDLLSIIDRQRVEMEEYKATIEVYEIPGLIEQARDALHDLEIKELRAEIKRLEDEAEAERLDALARTEYD